LFTPRKFEVSEFWPGDFFALFEQAGIPRRVPPPFLPDTASELASRAGQKPIIVSPNSKEILLVLKKTIPLRAKADADVREFSGSPAGNSLAKPHRIRFSSGPQPPAITNSPRWTITAAPVRIASLCDEKPGSDFVSYVEGNQPPHSEA
jgi:hypothetical protein